VKLSARDRRALMLLGAALAMALAAYWATEDPAPAVVTGGTSVEQAERRLDRLRQVAAAVPARQELAQRADGELKEREKGLLVADTAPQVEARLQQVVRRLLQAQAPPIELKSSDLARLRAVGDHYGEISIGLNFECRVEQLVNLLADFSAQTELLSATEIRIGGAREKDKVMPVRIVVSALVPRKLIPEKKGFGAL